MTMLNPFKNSAQLQNNRTKQLAFMSNISTKGFTRAALASALLGLLVLPAHAAESESNQQRDAQEEATNAQQTAMLSARNSKDGIIALVNDTPILKSDLAEAVAATQARINAAGEPVPSNAQLQNEVLDSLIIRELQLGMAKRAGIRPEPEAVNQSLARIAQSQGLTSLAQLQQTLDSRQPGSYAKLRARVIEEESIKVLQQSQVSNRVRISEQDIDAFLDSPEGKRLESTEYRTIHIRVPFSDDYSRITDGEKTQAMNIARRTQELLQTTDNAQEVLDTLTEGVAQGYVAPVQGGDMGYHPSAGLPTEIASQITDLSAGDVTEPQITPQGIDVVKLVDKRGNENLIVPQWKVRHILIKTDEMTSDVIAEQKINDLYEQLRRDADFANLASTYSDDPGSAGRGGDLDWVSEGQMVPEFEEMMQRTPEGDFSTPFKSQFGWHILKVEDIRQTDMSERVKRQMAREALYQRLAVQAKEDWLQELRANAYIRIYN